MQYKRRGRYDAIVARPSLTSIRRDDGEKSSDHHSGDMWKSPLIPYTLRDFIMNDIANNDEKEKGLRRFIP